MAPKRQLHQPRPANPATARTRLRLQRLGVRRRLEGLDSDEAIATVRRAEARDAAEARDEDERLGATRVVADADDADADDAQRTGR